MTQMRERTESGQTATKGWLRALSGPGIAFGSTPNHASGIGPGYANLVTVWDQQEFLQEYAGQLHAVPATSDLPGSGSGYQVVNLVVEVESPRLRASDELSPSRSLSEFVAEIRSALSLQIKELAEILHVERPTVYAWIKESSSPQKQNRVRLRQVARLAGTWNRLSNRPIGQAIREMDEEGRTIIDYMKEDIIPQTLIISRFRSIAQAAERKAALRKPSIRELADKHGIDLNKVRDQQDQIDIITGKRVSVD